ncbi:DUF6350 family protein [Kineococcus xinjiangensis]|nr:DUF6350 family protein [Kineococcus xinjiangensis]
MTTLLDRRVPRPDEQAPVTAADLLPLLPAAVRAAGWSLLVVVVGAVVAWTAATATSAPLSASLRVGTDLWLLAHGADVVVTGGRVGIVPLGITALAVVTAARQVRRWAEDQVAAERPLPWGRAAGVFAAGYALVAALVALVSGTPAAAVDPPAAALGGAVLAAAVLGGCALRWDPDVAALVPGWLRRCARPAAAAVTLLLAAGAALVAVALVASHERVLLLHEALGPGLVGGLLLTAAQALLLPDLAVWGVAWLTGTGFALGTSTAVTPAAVQVGALPALPVLGAVPQPGPLPAPFAAVVLLPVLVGVLAALLAFRRDGTPATAGERLAVVGGAGALTGTVVGVLSWLASGPAGPGRMAEVGPEPLLAAVAAGAEVSLGMLLAVGGAAAVARYGPRRVPHRLTAPLPGGTLSGRAPRGEAAAGASAAGPESAEGSLRARWQDLRGRSSKRP